MRTSRDSWTNDSAPVELAMPIEGRDPVVDRLERQFDHLLDLLACDQVMETLDIPRPQAALVSEPAECDTCARCLRDGDAGAEHRHAMLG